MRLSELHPALVHYPLALLPVAVGADAIASVTRDRELFAVGRIGIVLAAVSTAVAGVFGFIAQEEVDISDEARPVLQTHRTLNIVALGAITALAVVRARRKTPSLGYLIAGAATLGAVGFSAYLGGKLVYAHGAGVEAADGIYGSDPTVLPPAKKAPLTALKDLGNAIVHTVRDMAKGELLPAIRTT